MSINLISDTLTRPTAPMLAAMWRAEVGDDVFREDPTVNRLQAMAAERFGKAAALFCPSGTMTNQIAIKCHTQPMDEMICDENSHVYQYENGGFAFHSGISVRLLKGENGKINAPQVAQAIQPPYDWLPRTQLVVLENTTNKAGGSFYRLDEIAPIRALTQAQGLVLHLDGARLFNALVETGESTEAVGQHFDSISICLSKGLGAPVGSLLIGDADFIARARRWRKAMGGGMRQAGYLAAAGIYALDHHIERLQTDNDRAKTIATALASLPYVAAIRPVQTNIVIFDLNPEYFTGEQYLALLAQKNIRASLFGPQTVRFVTHLDITDEMMPTILAALMAD